MILVLSNTIALTAIASVSGDSVEISLYSLNFSLICTRVVADPEMACWTYEPTGIIISAITESKLPWPSVPSYSTLDILKEARFKASLKSLPLKTNHEFDLRIWNTHYNTTADLVAATEADQHDLEQAIAALNRATERNGHISLE